MQKEESERYYRVRNAAALFRWTQTEKTLNSVTSRMFNHRPNLGEFKWTLCSSLKSRFTLVSDERSKQ
ncbi:hypothetical protein [Serratia marcescens]|uniref:hypothetical protein n=1 Tax=Serratia marcescens TaxID=615 RepID=UPI0035BC3966